MHSRNTHAAGLRPAVRGFFIAAAAVLAQPAPAAEPALVPVKDFARKSVYEEARISPTGQYLAVSMPRGDQTMLGIIDLKNRKIAGTLLFNRGEHVYDFWWVGPERVIVSPATRDGPLDQLRLTGELYAMNADGSQKQYLFGYRGSIGTGALARRETIAHAWAFVLDPLPLEPEWALVSVIPWDRGREFDTPLIDRINVNSGQRRRVSVVPGYQPIDAVADRAGRLRMAYSRDRNAVFHLYASDDSVSSWTEVTHPGGAPDSIELHDASADGQSVFLTSDVGGVSCLREYRFDTASFRSHRCSDTGRLGEPLFGFDDDRLIGMRHESARPEYEFLEPNHPDSRLLQSLLKAFGEQRVKVTSATLDGKQLVVGVSADRNPGDFFLVDRQTKKAEYLVSRQQWIDPATMTSATPISYQTRDGVTIHGYLTARAGLKASKTPLVLLPHGGPHGIRNSWQWDGWAQVLASRGYSVLEVNYRGSGGFGQAHEQAGYRKWGTLMQDDLTDAVRWAIAAGIADPARVCILGGSYGGYAALMSATREPDLYRCAIGFAGVYDLVTQASDSVIADSLMGRSFLQRVLGDEKLMAEQSPVTHVARLKAPVLIAHGSADKVVPFSQAKQLRKALDQHGKAYEWLEFPGEEHGFHDDKNHELFLTKVLDFLDRHIGASAVAAKAAPAR